MEGIDPEVRRSAEKRAIRRIKVILGTVGMVVVLFIIGLPFQGHILSKLRQYRS